MNTLLETKILNSNIKYEINYKKYLDKAHPRITDVYIETHIFPHQLKLHLIGNYKLKNKTNRDIDTIMLNINHTNKINTLNFSRPFDIISNNKKTTLSSSPLIHQYRPAIPYFLITICL